MPTTLILGATSAMAEQTARLLAADGDKLVLAARDPQALEILAADLKVRGATDVHVLTPFDATQSGSFEDLLNEAGDFDRALIAYGSLPDQEALKNDPAGIRREMCINFGSVIDLSSRIASRFESKGQGTLAVISSVAGLRGRQSNYIYGSAKGGVILFLQGLRNRLQDHGVRVITLLPGFVDTPMTAEMKKGPLFVSSAKAGTCIHKALTRGKGDVVYVPGFWRFIMWIIRALPEPIFKRLKL
ncbi:SDR family oxidoreductase [Kiritimatiellaeota bacterium B1221]|nr:SDR family oxidoreductase [Kiritimatiellaeota bacterium B1221]